MRVLFIGPLAGPITGQSIASESLLEALQARFDVDVVDLSKVGFANGAFSVARLWQVGSILRQVLAKHRSADVIYLTVSESAAGNAKDLLLFAICFRRLHRMLIHLHGGAGMREIMHGRHGVLRRANEFFVRRVRGVVVLGPRLRSIYASCAPASRVHEVPNFADEQLFADADAIDAKFSRTDPLRVLFLSNLLPGKGHRELAGAIRRLPPSVRARLHVDIAGGFEHARERAAFLELIRDIPEVTYHGVAREAEKRVLLRNAHLFCLPTYYAYEGQPMSILEAYASGCAVVTTDHSGIRDIFEPEVNGFEVATRSEGAIEEAIARALASPELLRAMAVRNRAVAGEKYRRALFTERMIRLFETIGSEPGAPATRA